MLPSKPNDLNPSEVIRQFINRFVRISDEEMEKIIPYLQVRHFNKRAIVVNSGEIDRYFNYVHTGLVRKFIVHNNKDINLYFAVEGDIINATRSFLTQEPSEEILETLEPTTLISILAEDLDMLYDRFPAFERISRLVMADQLVRKEEWEIALLRETVRERFVNFVQKNPELLLRVPQKMLASYLNIEPETFSRLKHLLMKR